MKLKIVVRTAMLLSMLMVTFTLTTVFSQGKKEIYGPCIDDLNFEGTKSLEAQGDFFVDNLGFTVYAGRDIITYVEHVTQFKGYAISIDEDLIRYEWDFDGDGQFDWSAVGFAGQMVGTSYIYNNTGTFYATMRAREYDNDLWSMDSVKVFVKDGSGPQEYIEEPPFEVGVQEPLPADGIKDKYAIMINGGAERRFWDDVTFMYSTLTNDYGFTVGNIYLLNHNGTNPDGQNPNGMIDYAATKSNLASVFNDLSGIVDGDDLFFVWVTNHGIGYHGSGERYYGYLYYGYLASVDPGDEQDYLESNFKLRSLYTGGTYGCNHGMGVWKVRYGWSSIHNCGVMYRNKYVSSFTNVYFESSGQALSDNDIYIERFIDYLEGDYNRNGLVETDIGEVYDYDGDNVQPYDHASGTFDEDDWGSIDYYVDDFTNLATGVPGDNYTIFDYNLDNCIDIDINYHPGNLEVDGTDTDNQGLFDGLDVNDDDDMNDWVSIDEEIYLYLHPYLRDDEMADALYQISATVIPIFMEQCFSGGFIEDLSGSDRVISTATTEEAVSYGNYFVELFTSALHWATPGGQPVDADSDGNGLISMMEAFNYAAENDPTAETPQYDDNGDGTGHPYPIPNGGDGNLGATTYLTDLALTISKTSGGTTSPSPGSYSYWGGTTVSVTATPDANYELDHWELDNVDVGDDNPYSVFMDDDHDLHAVFEYSPLLRIGGIRFSVNKLDLLAPYISLTSTIIVATVATAIYVKCVKRRKEKQ